MGPPRGAFAPRTAKGKNASLGLVHYARGSAHYTTGESRGSVAKSETRTAGSVVFAFLGKQHLQWVFFNLKIDILIYLNKHSTLFLMRKVPIDEDSYD